MYGRSSPHHSTLSVHVRSVSPGVKPWRLRPMPQGTSSSVNIVILGLISVFLLSTPVFRSAPGKRHSQHESHGHDHKHGNDEHDQSSMTMNMVFTNSYRTTLWFSTVQTETPAAYFAVLCGLCLLAVVSEGLAQYRNARAGASQADELYRCEVCPLRGARYDLEHTLPSLSLPKASNATPAPEPPECRATAVQRSERAAAAGLHVLYIGIGYMLMLAVGGWGSAETRPGCCP